MKKYSGFTLIEMLVVIAIVTMMGVFLIPISISQVYMSKADGVVNQLSSAIYKQQQDAYSGYLDSEFGIKIDSNSFTTYRGNSFDVGVNKVTTTFQTETISTSLTGGSTEIHFEKGSLRPSVNGSLNVGSSGISIQVVVNKEGLIYVNK